MTSIQDSLINAATSILMGIVNFLPQIVAAVVVMLIGVVLARWVRALASGFLQRMHISDFFKKNAKLAYVLDQTQLTFKIEDIIGELLRWTVLTIFFITAVNTVGLSTVSEFLVTLLTYVPHIFSAVLIFVLGVLAAGFIEGVVKTTLLRVDVATARLAGKISSYTVMVFSALVAIGELGIAQNFIHTLFSGVVAMLALSLGLAFGLGSKDIVKQILEDWYANFSKETSKKSGTK